MTAAPICLACRRAKRPHCPHCPLCAAWGAEKKPRRKGGSFRVRTEKGRLLFTLEAEWLGDKAVEVYVSVESAREIERLLPALITEAALWPAKKSVT